MTNTDFYTTIVLKFGTKRQSGANSYLEGISGLVFVKKLYGV
jgi:hypothetical protein